jgi:hypothetical protein
MSLAALVALAARLWLGTESSGASPVVATSSLDSALTAWSVSPPERATVGETALPDRRHREWLVALRRTGLDLRWTTTDSSGGALVVESGPLPQASSRIVALGAVAGAVSDELGPIDSTRTSTGAVTWRATPLSAVRAPVGSSVAVAQPRDSLVTGPVLLIGQAGWESKFVTAALEEDGWTVATRMTVAPGAIVRQGPAGTIDTALFSAVLVLDSTSSLDANALARFVNQGGGLVASGAGASHPALRGLTPRVSSAIPGVVGAVLGPAAREGLNARTFAVSANLVPIERRGDAPVIVARRAGSGRVLVAGYDDTWRIRMTAPDESAPAAHRAWWSSLVASVAHSKLVPRDDGGVDEAPLAATFAALGPPERAGGAPVGGASLPWDTLLAALATVALLAEWLSRRLRGVA